jgi:hypothetical protein
MLVDNFARTVLHTFRQNDSYSMPHYVSAKPFNAVNTGVSCSIAT